MQSLFFRERIRIGTRVRVSRYENDTSACPGTIRWIGYPQFDKNSVEEYVGVELDHPQGEHNGMYRGHGTIVPLGKISLLKPSDRDAIRRPVAPPPPKRSVWDPPPDVACSAVDHTVRISKNRAASAARVQRGRSGSAGASFRENVWVNSTRVDTPLWRPLGDSTKTQYLPHRSPDAPNVTVGCRVSIPSSEVPSPPSRAGSTLHGTVKWIGNPEFAKEATEPYVGIDMDVNVGGHDGMRGGFYFFSCRRGHGVIVPMSAVLGRARTAAPREKNFNFQRSPPKPVIRDVL